MTPSMETCAPTIILRMGHSPCLHLGRTAASDPTWNHINVLASGAVQAEQSMAQHFELIVIGSGPAGRRAAVQAAKLKKSVLVIEKGRRVGGVCVHTGTIPSKTLRETVLNLSGWRERGFYGRA